MGAAMNGWTIEEVRDIYEQPFADLIFKSHSAHRLYHNPSMVETAKLLSIKTGACPEDCGYCSQSGHYKTGLKKEKLMSVETVMEEARRAKSQGAQRFCMGAAWRCPPEQALPDLLTMVKEVKALGMETCMTLGMLTQEQANQLKAAGLDYYNHNIDTSPSYYDKVITTRKFSDRLETLQKVREAGMAVCCGGILGLGESREDRVEFLYTLATLDKAPESVPINMLVPMNGTPLEGKEQIDPLELVRTIATARILMPKSAVRLSAGRTAMTDELQALCFFAGANSIFMGDKLLTTNNPDCDEDHHLLKRLGIKTAAVLNGN